MIEIFGYILIGLGVVLGLFGSAAAIACFFYLTQLRKAQDEFFKEQKRSQELLAEFRENLRETLERLQAFLVEFDGSLRTSIKGGFDNQIEASEKVIEASVEISNKNSQALMDTMSVIAQMMSMILKGLGYQPTGPTPEDSGLQEPKEGQNYNAPPAPARKKRREEKEAEDGLIYSKK
jgi:type II secretory pathway pseudopilin PulG